VSLRVTGKGNPREAVPPDDAALEYLTYRCIRSSCLRIVSCYEENPPDVRLLHKIGQYLLQHRGRVNQANRDMRNGNKACIADLSTRIGGYLPGLPGQVTDEDFLSLRQETPACLQCANIVDVNLDGGFLCQLSNCGADCAGADPDPGLVTGAIH
jgi:hypothetical protein